MLEQHHDGVGDEVGRGLSGEDEVPDEGDQLGVAESVPAFRMDADQLGEQVGAWIEGAAGRAAPPAADVTAVLVTSAPDELGPLAHLAIADLRGCLRAALASSAWCRLQIVHDESGMLAAAAGVPSVSDATESAVRIEAGRMVARADGFGACHAAASG